MNFTRLDSQFQEFLMDATGDIYSDTLRLNALQAAVLAYSEYFPAKRRIGTAHLWEEGKEGDSSITVIGGPFKVGDVITITDYFGTPEERTVSAVEKSAESAAHVAPTLTLTFAPTLSSYHPEGSFVRRETEGVSVVSDTDIYAMPVDFVNVDTESLSIALGGKLAVRRSGYYIDVTRSLSAKRSQVGDGMRLGFGGADIYSKPEQYINLQPVNLSVSQLLFQTGSVPLMRLIPVPTTEYTLEFDYYGIHSFGTLPEQARDAILCYAEYKAKLSRATAIIQEGTDVQEGDMKEDTSRVSGELRREADASLARFREIVQDSYGVSG